MRKSIVVMAAVVIMAGLSVLAFAKDATSQEEAEDLKRIGNFADSKIVMSAAGKSEKVCPDFSNLPQDLLALHFSQITGPKGVDLAWFANIKTRVERLSEGKATIALNQTKLPFPAGRIFFVQGNQKRSVDIYPDGTLGCKEQEIEE